MRSGYKVDELIEVIRLSNDSGPAVGLSTPEGNLSKAADVNGCGFSWPEAMAEVNTLLRRGALVRCWKQRVSLIGNII